MMKAIKPFVAAAALALAFGQPTQASTIVDTGAPPISGDSWFLGASLYLAGEFTLADDQTIGGV